MLSLNACAGCLVSVSIPATLLWATFPVPLCIGDEPEFSLRALDNPIDPNEAWVHSGFWSAAKAICNVLRYVFPVSCFATVVCRRSSLRGLCACSDRQLLKTVESVGGGIGGAPGSVGESKAEPLLHGEAPYQLIICGHSLGAGVASLLAVILKVRCVVLALSAAVLVFQTVCGCSSRRPQQWYPNLHCYAYAPPGATMSTQLSDAVSSFITSVVVGKDMVPRLCLSNVHALVEDAVCARVSLAPGRSDSCTCWLMLLCPQISLSTRARVSKATIMRKCFCGPGTASVESVLLPVDTPSPNTPLSGLYAAMIADMRKRRAAHELAVAVEVPVAEDRGSTAGSDVNLDVMTAREVDLQDLALANPVKPNMYRQMVVPGRNVLHLVKQASHKCYVPCLSLCCGSGRVYTAMWSPTTSFQEILVSNLMIKVCCCAARRWPPDPHRMS